MTLERFDFQRECATAALADLEGLIVNIGANEDPAHLKALSPERVRNCDLFEWDTVMDRPNVVDVLFDAAMDDWPFLDGEAALVVLGDMMEHLTPDEQVKVLSEARRVSSRVCITVPMDERETNNDETADKYPRGAVHRTIVTRQLLRSALEQTGWKIQLWRNVHYGFCPLGFFVLAD